MKRILLAMVALVMWAPLLAQDTTIIQTLTWDSTGRDYVFNFPEDTGQTYEKILMLYNMRCKNALVSTGSAPNLGCGEWDYSCNTYITDSSKTDSVLATHPNYVISDFSGTSFDYTTSPTYTYYQSTQTEVTYSDTTSETIGVVGAGITPDSHPFNLSTGLARVQYLFTAAELLGAGLSAGDITGMRLDLTLAGGDVNNLRINLKHTGKTNLHPDTLELDGFQNTYYLNTTFSGTGQHQFNFHNPFTWDGASNLIVELTFDGAAGVSSLVNGDNYGSSGVGLVNTSEDYSLEFNGGQVVNLGTPMTTVSNEITISFWCYGDTAAMPMNSTIFEGMDGSGRRQTNVHLPWSNSRIYWDCGNDGSGYDRIDKLASVGEIEGQWNHWAFTKNATTGSMKIYLNGTLWHSGTGKTRPIDIQDFNIGGAIIGGTLFYSGHIDEFRVWDAELAQTEIQNWMHKSVDGTHPNFANLVSYHKFNDGSGTTTFDETGFANGTFDGAPAWRLKTGENISMNFTQLNDRPQVDLIQGVYTTNITTSTVLDSLVNIANTVEEYSVTGSDLNHDATYTYWESGVMPVYDETGTQVGTITVSPDGTLNISDLTYYNKTPMKFEIMSLVTPYGIGLDLGVEGKTFTFDVTDFTPVLKGAKRMTLERGGQNQEEMDIKFLFISGTPPRDVIDIQQIWRVDSRGYASIIADESFEPRMVATDPTASMFDIRTVITGHGQEGEFIPQFHFVNAAGGANELYWQVWKECAGNPIPAQGGTWIYDRAGWCPGMESDLQRTDISSLVTPGDSILIDYGVVTATGTSNYIVNNQLVSYGSPNHSLDAHVMDVIKPSKKVEHEKFNPICSQPVVVIQNTGATTLTSLTINYSVKGGAVETFNWTGSLDFLETEEVTLPVSAPAFWTSSTDSVFVATCSAPNGGTDEYPNNDTFESEFSQYPVYSGRFIIQHRLNNHYYSNSFEIFDESGNLVYEQFGRTSGTYYDTILLAPGCYKVRYIDTVSISNPNSGNDGLSWWANTAQGTGYFRLHIGGSYAFIANPDFGSFFEHSFYITGANDIDESGTRTLTLYPNPTSDDLNINFYGFQQDQIQVEVLSESGKLVHRESFNNDQMNLNRKVVSTSSLSAGIYFVRILDKDRVMMKKFVKE